MGRNIITASYPKSHPELKVVNKNNSQPKIHGQKNVLKWSLRPWVKIF